MSSLHNLIVDAGVDFTRKNAVTKAEMQCVDAAVNVLFDDEQNMNVLHSGFALTALPHKKTDETFYTRKGGQNDEIILRVETGYEPNNAAVGIPYGSLARLILIYLSTEAVKNNSRVVELGSSMSSFLQRVGIQKSGKSASLVREQAKRISMCRLTFYSEKTNKTNILNGSFVRSAVIFPQKNDDQPQLWQDTVELDEVFYTSLTTHPLPLREVAVQELCGKSLALDIYIFLAYRLHVLDKPTKVSWGSLFKQFGASYSEKRFFVARFKDPLELALAVYPEAHVEVDESGLTLHPSPSPVPKARLPKFKIA